MCVCAPLKNKGCLAVYMGRFLSVICLTGASDRTHCIEEERRVLPLPTCCCARDMLDLLLC